MVTGLCGLGLSPTNSNVQYIEEECHGVVELTFHIWNVKKDYTQSNFKEVLLEVHGTPELEFYAKVLETFEPGK